MDSETKKALDEYEDEAPESPQSDWLLAQHESCELCGFMHIDPEFEPKYCPCAYHPKPE